MNRTKPKMTWKKKITDSTSPFQLFDAISPVPQGEPFPRGPLGSLAWDGASAAFLLDRRHLAAALAVALLCLSLPSLAYAGYTAKKKKDDHTLLMVSVMTEGGYALPGIAVAVKRQQGRKPKWKGVSDRRGELALRLPAESATYLVSTHSKNHEDQTRTVEVQDQKRVDVIFRLSIRHEKEKKK